MIFSLSYSFRIRKLLTYLSTRYHLITYSKLNSMNERNEIEICIDVLVIYSTISPTGSFIQPIETTHHLKRSFWSHWWRQGITPYGFKSLTLLFSWTVQNGLELKKKITIFLKKFFNGVILNIQRCRPTKVLHSALAMLRVQF